MEKNSASKINFNCELPDILDFLNLSRNIIRQMNLLKKTNMSEEHKQLTANAAVAVAQEALGYAEEYV